MFFCFQLFIITLISTNLSTELFTLEKAISFLSQQDKHTTDENFKQVLKMSNSYKKFQGEKNLLYTNSRKTFCPLPILISVLQQVKKHKKQTNSTTSYSFGTFTQTVLVA